MKEIIKVFIAINDDGEYHVGKTAEAAGENLNEVASSYLIRTVELTVEMARPVAEKGPTVIVPDAAGTVEEVGVTVED